MMKYLTILFLGTCALMLISCSDEPECSIEDWEGIYRGVKACNGDIEDDYIFQVIQSTAFPSIESVQMQIAVDGLILAIDGCDIVGGPVSSINGPETYGGSLDGDKISITASSIGGTCMWTGTRE